MSNSGFGTIPAHLPGKLAICFCGSDWFSSTNPGEAYHDMERVLRETRQRGFNCIRAELAPGLLYDQEGKRRGVVPFQAIVKGFNSNMQCIDNSGGAKHDIRERVMLLFELADKYDLHVIGTTWIYQDFLSLVGDRRLQEEIASVWYDDRLMFLARQWDRLLNDLKTRGLAHRLAFLEVANEVDCTPYAVPGKHEPSPTYEEWLRFESAGADKESMREIAESSVAFLRERHPDVLVTVDYGFAASLADLCPENVQIADHHLYTEGVAQGIMKACGVWPERSFPWEDGPSVEGNAVLKSVLRDDVAPWSEVVRAGKNARPIWQVFAWFYHNLDPKRYDSWCSSHFGEYRRSIEDSVREAFAASTTFARERQLPLVIDEGYIFCPPLNSRFVTTPEGRWGEEIVVNTAIESGYWGITPTTWYRASTPALWHDDSQSDWIRGLNAKILSS